MTELKILPASTLVGKNIADTRLAQDYDLTIMGLLRHGREIRFNVLPETVVEADDILLTKGPIKNILEV